MIDDTIVEIWNIETSSLNLRPQIPGNTKMTCMLEIMAESLHTGMAQ